MTLDTRTFSAPAAHAWTGRPSAGGGRGDTQVAFAGQGIDELVSEFMRRHRIPGMALAIVQAPYITRVVGYGIADQERKTLVAAHTLFNVGQLSQAFTAVAIMQLLEEGRLGLDDPLSRHLEGRVPANSRGLTIRHLLIQSSGLADYTAAAGFDYSREYSAPAIYDMIGSADLLFEPGTQCRPSASNAWLLGRIVAAASGTSYEAYVTRRQFEALGLRDTCFLCQLGALDNETGNGTIPFKHSRFLQSEHYIDPTEFASGYAEDKRQTTELERSAEWLAVPPNAQGAAFSHAAVVSTAAEISRWDIGLAGGILVREPQNRAFLYEPTTLANGERVPGCGTWRFPGHPGLMETKGNVPGYSSFLSRFTAPDELLCVTLLANRSDVPDLDILARKIAGAFDRRLAAPSAARGTETLQSPYSVAETIDRVAAFARANGATLFARIDHGGGAASVGEKLLPSEVLVFGNPRLGTRLMQMRPSLAIELPLRVMAREDENGEVWLDFIDPLALGASQGIDALEHRWLAELGAALTRLCARAVSAESIAG